MRIFWALDWNDGTPERDGDCAEVECAAEWPDDYDPETEADELRAHKYEGDQQKAADATREALHALVEDLPLGLLSNEDWVLKVSPHGYIIEDEDYDEEAEVRG